MKHRAEITPTPPRRRRTDHGPSWREIAQTRRSRPLGLSLRGRLLIYFTLLVFSSLGGSVWLLTERNQGAGLQMMSEMAQAVARSIAVAASGRDVNGLKHLAESQLGSGQVLAIEFLDAKGDVVASATRTGFDASVISNAEAKRAEWDAKPWHSGSLQTVVASAPMLGGSSVAADGSASRLAERVVVGVSTRTIARSTRAMVEMVGLVGTGVTISAILLSWVFFRRAWRPLKEFVTSVRAVIAGNLDAVVDAGDNDHVAELADAFNELISWVRKHRQELAAANAELASLIQALEQKVADRTAQLEAANGRLSGEIAEKEDFLRAVSHDLNAPLRNIGGMVSMLMTKNKDSLPAEVVNRLERIRKNVDVETDLINELLELSRIKTRRQTLDLVDTERLLWELRGMFENDLKTRHIEVILETSLPTLYAERSRIRQVFQNLIDNAIKYMGDGEVREIRIGCRVNVTEAAFYVRDTGMGIHPEDLDKVFFVFRRGRGEASSKVAGKGVGLASVKSIVETYAGQIRVESTLGAGTTFHFTINGKYVPSVAGQVPSEMNGQMTQSLPTLSAGESASTHRAA